MRPRLCPSSDSLLLSLLVLAACSRTPKPREAAYAPEAAPAVCSEALDQAARERCIGGDGEACTAAVAPIKNDIVFDESMTLVFPGLHRERLECILAFTSRGCRLGSASSCMMQGSARHLLGDDPGAKVAWISACDRGDHEGCWLASEMWRKTAPGDPQLAERACDLGSQRACEELGERVLFGATRTSNPFRRVEMLSQHPAEIPRGFRLLERACLLSLTDHGLVDCSNFRKMLVVPDCPRRDPDDLLPLLAEHAELQGHKDTCTKLEDRGYGLEQFEAPCEKEEPGGICSIDPSACPPANIGTRPHQPPREVAAQLKNAAAERTRVLDAHKSACANGSTRDCNRRIEIEVMRFDKSVYAEERNQGAEAAFDVVAAARELCTRNNADACVFAGFHKGGGVADMLRACDLGSALGCAIAGHDLRAHGGDPNRARTLLARACSAGIRWACGIR